MAIISCPECGKQVSDRAACCPECGCPISSVPVAPQADSSKEIEKLIVLARRAREASDSRNAQKYYNQILDKDPGNWEAIFYSVFFEASECKIRDISSAANSVANCIYSTFSAIADLENEAQKDEALDTVIHSAESLGSALIGGAVSHYNQYSTTNNAFSECSGRVVSVGTIYSEIESSLKKVFPEKKDRLVAHLKKYLEFLDRNSRWFNNTYLSGSRTRIDAAITEIQPEHRRRRELEGQISALSSEIMSLKTERKAAAGCLAYFLLPVGIIMLIMGLVLMSLEGDSWTIIVAIPELVIGALCLKKTPSEEQVKENLQKKEKLLAQRDALKDELQKLG